MSEWPELWSECIKEAAVSQRTPEAVLYDHAVRLLAERDAALSRAARAEAEAAALRFGLALCGQHEPDCGAIRKKDDGECDCPMRALSLPLAAAVALVVECAEAETLAERAPEGGLAQATVTWDCAQHRRAAVDALRAARGERKEAAK